jgi:hypothetical protein
MYIAGVFVQGDEFKYVGFGRDIALCSRDFGLRRVGAEVGSDGFEFTGRLCSEHGIARAGFCDGVHDRLPEATTTACDQDHARLWEGDLWWLYVGGRRMVLCFVHVVAGVRWEGIRAKILFAYVDGKDARY